jgi:actin-related protein
MYFDVANPESLLRCLLSALSSCPIDLRRDVLRNVIFVGGTVEFISNFERRMLKAVADAFGPAGDADKKSAFHSLWPLLHNENGGLGIVHPLPFSPSAFAWTAASVMGTAVLPPDQTVTQKVYKDMKQSDSNVADVCYDFLSTV